jgi:flagellar biogenesis protein FliO
MTELGSYLVETLITLLAVCALAVLVLFGFRRVGVGRSVGPAELVGRLPLDGRRAIYLVRVGKTVLVLGGSEAGLAKLAELPDDGLKLSAEPPSALSFRKALERVVRRPLKSLSKRDDAA